MSPRSQPTADFTRQVRDALAHLYDPAHLLRHPLTAQLLPGADHYGDPSRSLRDLIVDAVEALEPPRDSPTFERDRRPHLVLLHRYVDGFSTEDIVARLHISPRQFQREHRKGLQALSAYLWSRRPQSASDDGQPEPGLQAEMRTLGVELTDTPLSDVLQEVRGPAEALARRLGIGFHLDLPGRPVSCLCDRVLAKQTVISCLSALAARHPHAVQLAASSRTRAPSLRLSAIPPLPDGDAQDLEAALGTCRSLMLVQGGQVKVMRDDQGRCAGVSLTFRATVGPLVLVVDDNPRMLQLYERYLASGRYTITAAGSAAEAEKALASSHPDAIVLDVMMRDVDGWALLQQLRSRPDLDGVPIVVCSVLEEP
ncbi:MAG: response regulator, partial [Anaerolineae bacterium]|nr:response regulator [Anaerolineae bacterium]